jgi:hypothetical protein
MDLLVQSSKALAAQARGVAATLHDTPQAKGPGLETPDLLQYGDDQLNL